MRPTAIVLLGLILTGCARVNEWERSYVTMTADPHEPLPEESVIQVVDCSGFADPLFLERLADAEGTAVPLGYCNYEFESGGGLVSAARQRARRADLDAFARSIGADLVVFRINFLGTRTEQGMYSYLVPTYSTASHSGQIQTDDGLRANYNGSSTITGWQTQVATSEDTYDQYHAQAAFFQREQAADDEQ